MPGGRSFDLVCIRHAPILASLAAESSMVRTGRQTNVRYCFPNERLIESGGPPTEVAPTYGRNPMTATVMA